MKLRILFLFLAVSSVLSTSIAQERSSYSSVALTYNSVHYNFPEYYKAKFNSGLNILFVENFKKFRFSVGFGYSTKRYFIPELIDSNPLYFEQFSIPVYSIPLSISYFFLNESKNSLGLTIVQNFNKSFNYKFILYNGDFNILEKGNSSQDLCYSTGVGVIYRYHSFKNISLVFNPLVCFNLSSENNVLNTKTIEFNIPNSNPTIFVNIGLEYSFNRSFVSQFLNQKKPSSI